VARTRPDPQTPHRPSPESRAGRATRVDRVQVPAGFVAASAARRA
jgi:hypothetical protein